MPKSGLINDSNIFDLNIFHLALVILGKNVTRYQQLYKFCLVNNQFKSGIERAPPSYSKKSLKNCQSSHRCSSSWYLIDGRSVLWLMFLQTNDPYNIIRLLRFFNFWQFFNFLTTFQLFDNLSTALLIPPSTLSYLNILGPH